MHKKTSEHLLLSVSQFFGEESSTVTVDWTVYFLYFSSNYFVDTLSERKGENASILYNIALNVTLIYLLNIYFRSVTITVFALSLINLIS